MAPGRIVEGYLRRGCELEVLSGPDQPGVGKGGVCSIVRPADLGFSIELQDGEQTVERPGDPHIFYVRLQIRDAVHHSNSPSEGMLGIVFPLIAVGAQVEADRRGDRNRLDPVGPVREIAEPLADLKGRADGCSRESADSPLSDAARRNTYSSGGCHLMKSIPNELIAEAEFRIIEARGSTLLFRSVATRPNNVIRAAERDRQVRAQPLRDLRLELS